jgi:hypothetical protein
MSRKQRGAPHGAAAFGRPFTVPLRASAADLLAVATRHLPLEELSAVTSAAPSSRVACNPRKIITTSSLASLTVGRAIQPTGQYAGHCAFAALVRSSGAASSSPVAELRLCFALRALAVLHTLSRLLTEEDLLATVAATVGAMEGVGGGGGTSRRSSVAVVAAPTGPWGSALAYLQGMLATAATMESQYAGPLELAALAHRLRRRVLVLVEEDNRVDSGGCFPEVGSAGNSCGGMSPARGDDVGGPPLVIVTTRRQHCYPVLLRPPGASGVVPLTEAAVQQRVLQAAADVRRALDNSNGAAAAAYGAAAAPAVAAAPRTAVKAAASASYPTSAGASRSRKRRTRDTDADEGGTITAEPRRATATAGVLGGGAVGAVVHSQLLASPPASSATASATAGSLSLRLGIEAVIERALSLAGVGGVA